RPATPPSLLLPRWSCPDGPALFGRHRPRHHQQRRRGGRPRDRARRPRRAAARSVAGGDPADGGAAGNGRLGAAAVVHPSASVAAAARDLTVQAAAQAGLAKLTLLEEPQAALYAWVEAAGDEWRRHVRPGDVILVVDVGGGTSDFSLIAVGDEEGRLALTRL